MVEFCNWLIVFLFKIIFHDQSKKKCFQEKTESWIGWHLTNQVVSKTQTFAVVCKIRVLHHELLNVCKIFKFDLKEMKCKTECCKHMESFNVLSNCRCKLEADEPYLFLTQHGCSHKIRGWRSYSPVIVWNMCTSAHYQHWCRWDVAPSRYIEAWDREGLLQKRLLEWMQRAKRTLPVDAKIAAATVWHIWTGEGGRPGCRVSELRTGMDNVLC